MAESIISEVVSVIAEKLGSKAYREIMFAKDLDSHIKRLQQLKTTIEATMLDAKSLEPCSNAQKDLLEKLDCALADLVYFLDAKAARATQKEIMHGNKFINEVRLFFSRSNQLVSPFRDSHKLKAIIDQFESISRDHAQFGAMIRVPSVKQTQAVTPGSLWSNCHILTEVVIGRDKDREEIVSMLLDDSETFCVASIVGIGGVGKSTLAKYVYHDERVKTSFDVCLWVSTTHDFDVQKVLLKILAALDDQMPANCDIVQMYDCFQRVIRGKKFFLVLDNVWDQESLWQKWQDLKSLLALGANGSKVLVTTRNKKVASIMDCVHPYVLKDFTKEDSWRLFKHIALTQCQDPIMEAIGREIVERCPNVPLVIRSVGGLLAGKCSVIEWQAFRDDQRANFSAYGRDVVQTLKLSYDQLDERLKLCVAYCSLFPKGYEYDQDVLVSLWMSLGYIKPSSEGQRMEATAEECILVLVIQGFFKIEHFVKPSFGSDAMKRSIFSMDNLMHDLVLSISDFKYKMAGTDTCEIDERVCHLSLVQKVSHSKIKHSAKMPSWIFNLKQLESLLVLEKVSGYVSDRIFYRFPKLRVLSLSNLEIENVPRSLGELITLRYLDLSRNPISSLPNSVTNLVELLSLDVSYCDKLFEFPKGIRKLVNLRHIRNVRCQPLMPKGLASLTDLQSLDQLLIDFSEGRPRESGCGLAELNRIINRLTGQIIIDIKGDARSGSFKGNEEHWESNGNLVSLKLFFKEGNTLGDEMVLECLQPNTNLRDLLIFHYKGERLPRWMKDGNHYFENLVNITLRYFDGCRSLGSFGKLLHLKVLYCKYMWDVEYIEEACGGGTNPYFPSLEELRLIGMPKLKKWYKEVSNGENCLNSSVLEPKLGFPKLQSLKVDKMEFVYLITREFRGFSSLKYLQINDCEDLEAIPDDIPFLSNLELLRLIGCFNELRQRCREPNGEDWPKIKHIPDLRI